MLIHQNYVRTSRLEGRYALRNKFVQAVGLAAPSDIICAELPNNEVRSKNENVPLQPGNIARDGVAYSAAVYQLYPHIWYQSN